MILCVFCLNDLGLETLKQNNIRNTWETNMRLLNRMGQERNSFNSRFLGSLQILIFETNWSQWKPWNQSVRLQRKSKAWVDWEISHHLPAMLMLELLKKLSETESLNRRGQIIKIQQQQRKMRYQITDLTFTNGNSQRDDCLMRFKPVPHPFPRAQWLSLGPVHTSHVLYHWAIPSPQTGFHPLDTDDSHPSSAARL